MHPRATAEPLPVGVDIRARAVLIAAAHVVFTLAAAGTLVYAHEARSPLVLRFVALEIMLMFFCLLASLDRASTIHFFEGLEGFLPGLPAISKGLETGVCTLEPDGSRDGPFCGSESYQALLPLVRLSPQRAAFQVAHLVRSPSRCSS